MNLRLSGVLPGPLFTDPAAGCDVMLLNGTLVTLTVEINDTVGFLFLKKRFLQSQAFSLIRRKTNVAVTACRQVVS